MEFVELFVRWAHVVAAISWIGSSFYFMWLDASLKRRAAMPTGVKGENWTVHGGGFYHTQKYMVAPDAMPDDLHWFKWEAYATWLSGAALIAVLYWWNAELYLIDPSKAALDPWQAIALSAGGLVAAWLIYDGLCRSPLARTPLVLFGVLFALITATAYLYGLVFSGRAAFLQTGAMIATAMSGNVFFVIIPNQRVVVADLKAGRTPDPKYGEIAKLRSTHNNYLTLPVIFLMLSNHYPATFGHGAAWVFVVLALFLGAIVRHWFNTYETGAKGAAIAWQWPAALVVAGGMTAFAAVPLDPPAAQMAASAEAPAAVEAGSVEVGSVEVGSVEVGSVEVGSVEVGSVEAGREEAGRTNPILDEAAFAIMERRCVACHADEPTFAGLSAPPGGVALHTPALMRRHASSILAQSVDTHAMPLGNVTAMTADERAALAAWARR